MFQRSSDNLEFVEDDGDSEIRAMKVKVDTDMCCQRQSFRESVIGDIRIGDEQTSEADISSGLVRLCSAKVSEQEVENLQKTAKEICNEEPEAETCVYQIVVSCKDALREDNPDKPGWLEGIESEVLSLFDKTGVLKLIHPKDLREGDEVIPSMLVLTQKPCGRKKARIVACGNFQRMPSKDAYCGVVAHDGWIQNMLIAQKLGLEIAQIDVSTAFLQTDPVDDDQSRVRTILRPPKQVPRKSGEEHHLWEVTKSIYGLRSAPASWKQTLVRWLKSEGFVPCEYDENVFRKPIDGTNIMIYVDDLVFVGEKKHVQDVIRKLKSKFECTDETYLSQATKTSPLRFLGHHLWTTDGEFHIDQADYAKTLIQRFNLEGCSPANSMTPDVFDREFLKTGTPLTAKEQSTLRQIVGGIQYLAQGTRPDISSAIAMISEGQSGGTSKHIEAGKKLLRYIAGSANRHIVLKIGKIQRGDTIVLRADFDASFGKSYARSGLVLFINDQICYWQTRRQRCITLSTAEAELVAATNAGKECVGARNFLRSVWGEDSPYNLKFRMVLRGDNQAANLISARQASLRKVRHLCLADLYIRQIFEDEDIVAEYVQSSQNSSDALTKVLGEQKLSALFDSLCLRDDGDVAKKVTTTRDRPVSGEWLGQKFGKVPKRQ